jgi:orotate phosphoribosyltransferase
MKEHVAAILLEKKAVTLNVQKPYTYVSGIRSPIYTDNRLLIGYPKERSEIVQAFCQAITTLRCDVIAGTATAGIPWAAWISDRLNKPLAYIRADAKAHGKGNTIEGALVNGTRVVVIEDLVSTGGSSLAAVETARSAGAEVVALVAIFTYEFADAKRQFEEKHCTALFLSDFSTLTRVAAQQEYISSEELTIALEWNKDPAGWGPKHGFPLGEKKN